MNRKFPTVGILLALFAAGTSAEETAGKFYGLWWDGSTEHFVSLDPYTASKTVIAEIPDVNLIQPGNYTFDPDSSRYAFVGGETNDSMRYHVVDAPTGTVIANAPRTDALKGLVYSPGARKVYGLWWSDSSAPAYIDSAGHPHPPVLAGTEYFVALDPYTGARTNTEIPGVETVRVGSHFLDSDSGRYVFAGADTGGTQYYYVIDVTTGGLLAQLPHAIKIDNPVYNPALNAVHGLWWSDSSYYDTLPGPGDFPRVRRIQAGTEYFITLSPDSTVSMTEVPGVMWITLGRHALDTDSNRYVFAGKEASGPFRYYVIDALTGEVLSSTEAPDKIDNIAYAPASSTIDSALLLSVTNPGGPGGDSGSAGEVTALSPPGDAWTLRAFPHAGPAVLEFENPGGESHVFTLHDLSGRTVMFLKDVRGDEVRIDKAGLKRGVHLFRLRNARGLVAAGKLTVE